MQPHVQICRPARAIALTAAMRLIHAAAQQCPLLGGVCTVSGCARCAAVAANLEVFGLSSPALLGAGETPAPPAPWPCGRFNFVSDAQFREYLARDATERMAAEVRMVIAMPAQAQTNYMHRVRSRRCAESYGRLRDSVIAGMRAAQSRLDQ